MQSHCYRRLRARSDSLFALARRRRVLLPSRSRSANSSPPQEPRITSHEDGCFTGLNSIFQGCRVETDPHFPPVTSMSRLRSCSRYRNRSAPLPGMYWRSEYCAYGKLFHMRFPPATASPSGCSECCSAIAALSKTSRADAPSTARISVTSRMPVVRVPVLSRTMVSISASFFQVQPAFHDNAAPSRAANTRRKSPTVCLQQRRKHRQR